MGDITTSATINEVNISPGLRMIQVDLPATADTGDTFTVTLTTYGIKLFMGIYGCVHTTANSVIVAEAPTTSVSSATLTVTVGGSTASNYIRSYLIWGK